MPNIQDTEAELKLLESRWQTMTSAEKDSALARLDVLHEQLATGEPAPSLTKRIAALRADIDLAAGLEPPTPEQGLKA